MNVEQFRVKYGTYVHKAMYSVQNRPREGELVVNGMKVPRSALVKIDCQRSTI